MKLKKYIKKFTFQNIYLLGAICDAVLLFSVLAYLTTTSVFIKYVNETIALSMFESRNEQLVEIFKIITYFGETKIIALLVLMTLPFLWKKNKKPEIFTLLTAVGGSGVLIYIFKHIMKAPRPEFSTIIETSYSFPSGHSTITIAFYGLLIWYFFIRGNTNLKNVMKAIVTTAVALLIPLSRLILGVHYFFDIIGGIILGTVCLLTGIVIFRFVEGYLRVKHN